MDNGMIKRQIRELCRSPQPERKAEFFLGCCQHSCFYLLHGFAATVLEIILLH